MSNNDKQFYAELDEQTAMYCVFDTEDGKAHSSWASMEQAEEDAAQRNKTKPTQKRVTLATVKSFIKKNLPNLHIMTKTRFDGMVDGVREVEGAKYRKVDPSSYNPTNESTLGLAGVWFVRSSRDYFGVINTPEWTGFEVSNCCGCWEVVIPTKK